MSGRAAHTALSADWLVPIDGPPIEGGVVAYAGETIVDVGPPETVEAEHIEHFPGCVIVPGLINAHTHLEYTAFAGFGDGMPFGPWLDLHMQRKRRLAIDDLLAGARLGAAQCLAGGVTTVSDASYAGAAAAACAEAGLRAITHLEIFGRDPEIAMRQFEERRGPAARAASERVQIGISPHAPYSAALELYRAALELGEPVATHLAESPAEHEFMLGGSGPIAKVAAMANVESPATSSVRYLYEHGALRPSMSAAHCVLIDETEIELLAQCDIGVVHCPRSNAQLGCGIAPLRALREAGIRVGLGTDSPASAASFDMFEEMRCAIGYARAREQAADALSTHEALALATLGSAAAIGRAVQLGSLTPGKAADLTVIDLSNSNFVPVEDPAAAVVYGGSPECVSRTIVGGETRYERRGFRWPELRAAVRSGRASMIGRARHAAT